MTNNTTGLPDVSVLLKDFSSESEKNAALRATTASLAEEVKTSEAKKEILIYFCNKIRKENTGNSLVECWQNYKNSHRIETIAAEEEYEY